MDYKILFNNGLPIKDFIGVEEYTVEVESDLLVISFLADKNKDLGKKLIEDILGKKKYEFHIFENYDSLSVWLEIDSEYYVAIEGIENKFIDFFKSNFIKIYIYIDEDRAVPIQMF